MIYTPINLRIYKIELISSESEEQNFIVPAKSITNAEEIFKQAFSEVKIKSITLLPQRVLIDASIIKI